MRYKLTCLSWNNHHVRFNVFDRSGANCGTICVLAEDVVNFLQNSWKGNIDWDNQMPDYIINYPTPLTNYVPKP